MASFDQVVVIRKPTVVIEKPLMQLKDYLVEDQSSCSSNGFKSFPRKRQCCTTVRFLMEIDLKQSDLHNINDPHGNGVLRRSRSKTASARASVLQRASDAVINAVKHLPYSKLLRRRFWGRKGRPRLALAEDDRECGPSDREVEFGSSEKKLRSFSSSGEYSAENDVSLRKVNSKVNTTVGEDSSTEGETTTVKEWPNEEEKEQFSPVSILDCPFEDDDDHTSSPNFHQKLVHLEGTKQKILQKIRRFENLAHLEPLDLEKRIATLELDDKKLATRVSTQNGKHCDKTNKSQHKAMELMKLFQSKNNNLGCKADNLMFDYFKERAIIEESNVENNAVIEVEKEALKVMEDWVNGETREVLLGWEVKEGRMAYVKGIERGGNWKGFDYEKQEVGLDLEANIWDSLVHDLLLDIL